jgi:transposase InsO family protein
VAIERANQVWSTDITYISMPNGFMYLTAMIDWYSRYVLSWRLSNTLDVAFCLEALEEALRRGCCFDFFPALLLHTGGAGAEIYGNNEEKDKGLAALRRLAG